MRPPGQFLFRLVWASPCSLLGVLFGLPVMAMGGELRRVGHTLEIACRRVEDLPAWARRLRFQAITFGQVIIGQSHESLQRLRIHERVHVRQYERWGPFFLIAYPVSSLRAWLRGGCPYRDNHFEIEAFSADSSHRHIG